MSAARSAVTGGVLGLLGALGLILFHASVREEGEEDGPPQGGGAPPAPPPIPFAEALPNILGAVARNEGGSAGYGAINANTDGQGLSYGLFQWSQRSGNLGALLAKMYAADPGVFASIFGIPWRELLSQTAAGSLAPVGGVVLWAEPWLSRFRAAASHPQFQVSQSELAATDPHMRTALAVAMRLGVETERGLALCLDRVVQQGPTGFRTAVAGLQLPATPYAIARACLGVYRADAPREDGRVWRAVATESALGEKGELRAVGGSYHAFRGAIDLHETIARRCAAILGSATLRDGRVDVRGWPT